MVNSASEQEDTSAATTVSGANPDTIGEARCDEYMDFILQQLTVLVNKKIRVLLQHDSEQEDTSAATTVSGANPDTIGEARCVEYLDLILQQLTVLVNKKIRVLLQQLVVLIQTRLVRRDVMNTWI
ncbi:hypothetical protein J6590_087604 [Homalodisca vitripennis]|nr:hypothetical protein J6590_087604 [Homalodisca vitripennis]